MDSFILALQQSAPGEFLDNTRNVAIALQVLHILFFTAVLAVVMVLALRVWGVLFKDRPVHELSQGLRQYYRLTLVLALLAGFLQSLPRLLAYSHNSPFVAKLLFLVIAIFVQGLLHHRLAQHQLKTGLNKTLALLSVLFWVLAAAAGRAIGFV
jgi:hypothetical protein